MAAARSWWPPVWILIPEVSIPIAIVLVSVSVLVSTDYINTLTNTCRK